MRENNPEKIKGRRRNVLIIGFCFMSKLEKYFHHFTWQNVRLFNKGERGCVWRGECGVSIIYLFSFMKSIHTAFILRRKHNFKCKKNLIFSSRKVSRAQWNTKSNSLDFDLTFLSPSSHPRPHSNNFFWRRWWCWKFWNQIMKNS